MELSKEVFNKLKNRDPQALKEFYLVYKDKIYNYLLMKTNYNRNAVEDIFSDTIYSILKSIPNIKNDKNLNSWVLQIANRRLYDYINKNKNHENNLDYIDEISNSQDNTNENEEESVKEKLLLTNMAMEAIKPEFKQILELKYIDNLSQNEIAEKLNKTALSVQGILYRAREAIKKEIKRNLKDFQ